MIFKSLRFRILLLVLGYSIAVVILISLCNLRQFEISTKNQLQHEGLLLADALAAGITSTSDLTAEGLQARVDRLVTARQNDVEVNVILLDGDTSVVVASNVPDNLEEADEEEHQALLSVLADNKPIVVIGEEDISSTPTQAELLEQETANIPSVPPGERFLEVTAPLTIEDQPFGSINVKLSLVALDNQLENSRNIMIAATLVEILVIGIGLGLVLEVQLFRPLTHLADNMQRIANRQPEQHLPIHRKDEIGKLAQVFNSMADQLSRARAQLHQYLNPMAIEEAYRRATTSDEESRVEQKELTLLFADIVGFTPLTEKIGPTATVSVLNQYFDTVVQAVVKHGGHIDKFIADEMVCIFAGDNQAEQSVEAAREILRLVENSFTDVQLEVRIGINTGSCMIVDVGSTQLGRLDRTVIGDSVNIAQRLMTQAKPNTAVVSAFTVAQLSEVGSDLQYLALMELKGKQMPTPAFELHI